MAGAAISSMGFCRRQPFFGRLACILLASLVFLCAFPGSAAAEIRFSESGDAASDQGCTFALSDFHKAKRGSDGALSDGTYYGYRYITGARDSIVLLASQNLAVVYVPRTVCAQYGIDLEDREHTTQLLDFICALDETHSEGGATLSSLELETVFTSNSVYRRGSLEYRFCIESGGRTYSSVYDRAYPKKSSSAARFCDYASIVGRDEVTVASDRLSDRLASFFSSVDWRPLFVSARTSLLATLIVAVLGVLIAWQTSHANDMTKSIVDAACLLSMVLPPTILGLILLFIFGKNSPTGQWLISMGINLPFTWPAAVIAAVVVAFPYMYRSARGAFDSVDDMLLDCARTLGWGEWRVFRKLALPLASSSLLSGVILSFARALGEFGATMFFAGNYAGTTETLPIAIYYDWMAGDAATAWLWVIVVLVLSLISMLLMNRVAHR
ncbi:MAG: molybdate ABC transporter permease subunit [Coriobacteriales bacterium]